MRVLRLAASALLLDWGRIRIAAVRYPPETPLVAVNGDDRLEYRADARGNRAPDFSTVGYRGGADVVLPLELPVQEVYSPIFGTSARESIQDALDLVGSWPFHDGTKFRGVVRLKPGRFEVDDTLYLRHSGVVLQGEGEGENRAIVESMTTEEISLIEVGAVDDELRPSFEQDEVGGSGGRVDMIDAYVIFCRRKSEIGCGTEGKSRSICLCKESSALFD